MILFCLHTAVYITFRGSNLPNHGYVNISHVGNTTDTGLVCSTDHSGDGAAKWFNPDGTRMKNTNSSEGFYISNGSDGVYLLRGSGILVEGIYKCVATDSSGNSRTVFVGLYSEGGGGVVSNCWSEKLYSFAFGFQVKSRFMER